VEQAGGIMTLMMLTAAGATDQIRSVKHFGNPQLRRLELDASHLRDDIEDRVRFCAGADRACPVAIPPPTRMPVGVMRVETAKMLPAFSPMNAETVEDVGLSTLHRLTDLSSRDIAIVYAAGGHAISRWRLACRARRCSSIVWWRGNTRHGI
jgi:hypothetical protein